MLHPPSALLPNHTPPFVSCNTPSPPAPLTKHKAQHGHDARGVRVKVVQRGTEGEGEDEGVHARRQVVALLYAVDGAELGPCVLSNLVCVYVCVCGCVYVCVGVFVCVCLRVCVCVCA